MNMDDILKTVESVINNYDSGAYIPIEKLTGMLRELTGGIYHLTVIHTKASEEHNAYQYNFSGSVARGLIEADYIVPEYKMTRKILDTCNRVQSAMIMELSVLKREM